MVLTVDFERLGKREEKRGKETSQPRKRGEMGCGSSELVLQEAAAPG